MFEVTEDGRYTLVLVFEAKALELSDFEQRQVKFINFYRVVFEFSVNLLYISYVSPCSLSYKIPRYS